MRQIGKEMSDQVTDTLLRLHILLPAPRTIPLFHPEPAVQTIFLVPKMMAAHKLFF
jgi:hypothetical protein